MDESAGQDHEAVLKRACRGKAPYGQRTARQVAAQLRAGGQAIGAYPCPWGHPGRWHVGHVPSIESVERLAAALRARAGNAPGPSRAPGNLNG